MTDASATLIASRRTLHGVAELLLAGPQYRRSGELALRVSPGGFATSVEPTVQVDGVELVTGPVRTSLAGTYREVAAQAGLQVSALTDVYSGGLRTSAEDALVVDPTAARLIADALALGDAALRAFREDQTPILWPEHFDVAITVDGVNYGVSPGDDDLTEPYAYVGPHEPRRGDFWNQPFGSAVPLAQVGAVAGLVEYFSAGREHAGSDRAS